MEKLDLKKTRKKHFSAKSNFEVVELEPVQYLMVQGHGSPASAQYMAAIELLYPIAYNIKFALKQSKGDFVVPPLEGLWWADDMDDYVNDNKENWKWTLMIMVPDFVDGKDLQNAQAAVAKKKQIDTSGVELKTLDEGQVVQVLHIGPYSQEGPLLHRLHHEFMPANSLDFNGLHHEIYLGDPRKSEPAKLKTILRQPVRVK